MTREAIKLPLYAKATTYLLGLFAFLTILFIAKGIIVPLVFATIIAIMLNPVVDLLVRLKIYRILAIIIVMFLTFLLFFAFGILLISQVNRFSDSLPVLVDKFTSVINQTITDAVDYFNKDPQKIQEWLAKTRLDFINTSTALLGQTLVFVGSSLVIMFLLPVYVFLILFYKPLLLEFIHRLFGVDNHSKVSEIVSQIKTVIQRYLFGLVIEAFIVAALDTAALLILGIEYALLLGILGALLNMIPYIGGLVAVLMPMIVAFVTKSSYMYVFYVMAAYYFIQLIDNNYIVPYIVASKVKINALFSIIVVIAGNALWGVPGMFLSIPILAIVKLICDHIESLKPLGFLLGDNMGPLLKIPAILKKQKIKSND